MDQYEDLTVVLDGEWTVADLPPLGYLNHDTFLGHGPRTLAVRGRQCNRLPDGRPLPKLAAVSFWVRPEGWSDSMEDLDLSILERGRPRIVPTAEVFAEAV